MAKNLPRVFVRVYGDFLDDENKNHINDKNCK